MDILLTLLGTAARLILRVYMLLLFIRWSLPFFASGDGEGGFSDFICAVTEPVLALVCSLLQRLGVGDGYITDASFLVTYLFLSVIYFLLRFL